jgi:hypothetical protein
MPCFLSFLGGFSSIRDLSYFLTERNTVEGVKWSGHEADWSTVSSAEGTMCEAISPLHL